MTFYSKDRKGKGIVTYRRKHLFTMEILGILFSISSLAAGQAAIQAIPSDFTLGPASIRAQTPTEESSIIGPASDALGLSVFAQTTSSPSREGAFIDSDPKDAKASGIPATPPEEISPQAPASPSAARAAATSRMGELNLSNEQTAAIVEMRRQWKTDEEKKVKDELKAARQELNEVMSASASADEAKKKFQAVQALYIQLQTIKFEKSLQIREILSPEQRLKFQALRRRGSN